MPQLDAPGQPPTPRRRKTDQIPVPPETKLIPAVLLLGARQLVDIWLSLFTQLQNSIIIFVLWLATLRVVFQVPTAVYIAIATTGMLLTFVSLLGSWIFWQRGERQERHRGE